MKGPLKKMNHNIINAFKITLLSFLSLISSCSKNNNVSPIITHEYEIELNTTHTIVESSIVKKNENDFFIVCSNFDCTFQFALVIDRNNRKNNEEVTVEHFADREKKSLIKSYNYEFFVFTGTDIFWLIYFELDYKKDTYIYLNVKGINNGGGDSDDDCDTYYCSFSYSECPDTIMNDYKRSSWPIASI